MAASSSSLGTSVNRQVKTCHQCPQHRSSATACKGQRKKKPCTLLYCQKCLLNRYGEKAEEAEASEVWSCPKTKRGHLPTGNLSHKAKAAGYSSVSQLLHAKGPENFGLVKNANDTGASLKKRRASEKCPQHRSSATARKGQPKKKPCTLLYCQKCLLNRYGEKAEEAEASEVWSCPKCRDICNCSICRAKRGHLPIGNLSHKAKAAGY
ncbi:hypothetical protein DCAR_0519866 [Daucus carota subsp. sativus]|uniref:Zinc-finger domain-containing protein n=1 Tax=Daucus carota subsp. sativus TaxID=79200 RepID=A0AAF1B1J4_DAUCS|nr:hypothetical protein DCAR_0519866 [Daucus carota subsp. sativus]